jgi:hypothetical protein
MAVLAFLKGLANAEQSTLMMQKFVSIFLVPQSSPQGVPSPLYMKLFVDAFLID